MARARNIKPGLFKNEILGVADPIYTLLFEGLWVLSDREGRLEDRPLRVKAEIFPYRDGLEIEATLDWLQINGFILRYRVQGVPYIQVLSFSKHQNPHRNEVESVIPPPDEGVSSSEKIGSRSDFFGMTPADSLNPITDSLNSDSGLPSSVPNGTGAEAPGEAVKTPEQMTKDELWVVGKSLLEQSGMPAKQCGTFVGKLVKDYGAEIVVEAVRNAVVERPADAVSFLKAACMARKGKGGKSLIPWHATDAGVIAKGLELTPPIKPHPGEYPIQFKARVLAAIENQGKPREPKPPPTVVTAGEPKRVEVAPELAAQRSANLKAALRRPEHES